MNIRELLFLQGLATFATFVLIVKRFVQSSTPSYKLEKQVPELNGKRLIERRLTQSRIQSIIIRNPAFMDVFLVMGGFGQAEDQSFHGTTKREYGLVKWYRSCF